MNAGETRAWVALTLNAATLPGLGTLLLRRWIAGAVQLVLSTAGAIGAVFWLVAFVRAWSRLGSFPIDRGPLFPAGLAGTIAFVVAWVWSVTSTWRDVRAASPGDGR